MRNQTISTSLSEAAELLAEPIDPTGWLAGPRQGGSRPDGAGRAGTGHMERDPAGRAAVAGSSDPDGRSTVRTTEPRRVRRPVRRTSRSRPTQAVNRSLIRADRVVGNATWTDPAAAPFMDRAASAGGGVLRRVRADEMPDGYRMGRWARLAITVTVLTAAAVLTVSLAAGSGPTRMVDVTVGPGDTLWSIATVAAPDRDPRAVIDEIRELNDVPGTVLPVGVVLRVPVSAE